VKIEFIETPFLKRQLKTEKISGSENISSDQLKTLRALAVHLKQGD